MSWNHRKISQEVDYKNKLSSTIQTSKPSFQTSQLRQKEVLIDHPAKMIKHTLDEFQEDSKKLHRPFDLAMAQQRAFQQFDLIVDAERDLNKKIVKMSQVDYGKETVSTFQDENSIARFSSLDPAIS